LAWQGHSLRHYLTDPECRFYLRVLLSGTGIAVGSLYFTGTYDLGDSLLHGSFSLVSSVTTSGFVTVDRSSWPQGLLLLIFLFAFAGGCAGSTGGGLKQIRVLLIAKQGLGEIRRLIHPKAIQPLKLGERTVPNRVVEAV